MQTNPQTRGQKAPALKCHGRFASINGHRQLGAARPTSTNE